MEPVYRPLTYSQQKQLIPVANKPVLFYAIEDVIEAGIRDIDMLLVIEKRVGVDTGPIKRILRRFV